MPPWGSSTTTSTTYGLRQLHENDGITAVSLSAEYELTLFNDLDVVVGGGHHWQDPDGLDNETDYSLLAGLNYHLNQQLSLHGSWTRKIRMPSIRNLFDASRGNPGLRPERMKGFEAGMDYAFAEMATLKVTGFYYDINDFIQNDRVTKKFQNIEKARVQGVEFSLVAQPLEKLDTRLSVSLQDSKDRSGSGRQQLTNTPGRIVSMDLDYEILHGIAAHLKLLNIADQYYYTRNAPYIKAKLGEATRLDLRLRWKPAAGHISAYVGVDNVFDANYEDEYALPAPGRMLFAGISWRK